jgi:branched-subunit amino acid transport protein AzlD
MHKALVIALIYIGTCFYTLAAYLHLSLGDDWTFLRALAIALPLVFLEYQFSLRGNHAAITQLGFNAIQVLMITLCFYFINLWLLNVFILKHKVLWWRELLCFGLILLAFAILLIKVPQK